MINSAGILDFRPAYKNLYSSKFVNDDMAERIIHSTQTVEILAVAGNEFISLNALNKIAASKVKGIESVLIANPAFPFEMKNSLAFLNKINSAHVLLVFLDTTVPNFYRKKFGTEFEPEIAKYINALVFEAISDSFSLAMTRSSVCSEFMNDETKVYLFLSVGKENPNYNTD
jgi:hypothetical protein